MAGSGRTKRAARDEKKVSNRVLSRREFLGAVALGAGAVALGGCNLLDEKPRRIPAAGSPGSGPGRTVGYDLEAAPAELEIGGRGVRTWAYNGGLTGPEIRVKRGDTLRVRVSNRLPEDTTIHWHGLPVPNDMDGVPDVTQPPIRSGENFTYEFEVPVSGTYLYHSHAGLQLDRALYGPLIVEPENERLSYDREYTLLLDDWLDGVDGTPENAMKRLKAGGSAMDDMQDMGDGDSMKGMEGMGHGDEASGMEVRENVAPRQWPPDLVYPLYLVNGKTPDFPEEFVVRRGETVRLRIANPSSSTIFRVALAGHRMTVVEADGQPVEPVEADAIRIGMGERYDVLVDAKSPGVWQLAARAEGTQKIARALFRYKGTKVSPPSPDAMPSEMDRKMLAYDMLRATPEAETPQVGDPDETIPVRLTGDEESFVWMMNGKVFAEADPMRVDRNRRIRFEFRNETMMPHPMHLHGHFFRVDNGTGGGPIKDTVIVEPMQKLAVDWFADNPGEWAFHCHMLYHQEAGMMRIVKVA